MYFNPTSITNNRSVSINQATAEAENVFRNLQRIARDGQFTRNLQSQMAGYLSQTLGIRIPGGAEKSL